MMRSEVEQRLLRLVSELERKKAEGQQAQADLRTAKAAMRGLGQTAQELERDRVFLEQKVLALAGLLGWNEENLEEVNRQINELVARRRRGA